MSIDRTTAAPSAPGDGARRTSVVPAVAVEPQGAGYLENLRYDVPASLVVFLVALPLCLGIAVASGAPPLAGLITGIVGGLVVAWASGSQVAVSGPAAGLTVIVLGAINHLGYDGFLLAVCIAGALQLAFGAARAGIFAYYFPSSVIKGMLAAIGIILIVKQVPHAVGFDADFEGDMTLLQPGQLGPLEQISFGLSHLSAGATIVTAAGLAVLVTMGRVPFFKKLSWLPAPLVVVLLGIALNALFAAFVPSLAMTGNHLVSLPEGGPAGLLAALESPDFSRWNDPAIYQVAATIAVVASLETLLCVEAMDKLDPYKRSTPTNRELGAQGLGNIVSGLLGGLPMTAVIVRGSANIQGGGRTRVSAFLHGALLLVAVMLLPWAMNRIPLAALAAILLHVGYKLAPLGLFKKMLPSVSELARSMPRLARSASSSGAERAGGVERPIEQWLPFFVTVAAILATDLLKGVGIGVGVAIFFLLRANMRVPYFMHRDERTDAEARTHVRLELADNVSFLNKAALNAALHELPDGAIVEIDARSSRYIHPDVLELLHEFASTAHTRKMEVQLVDVPEVDAIGAH